MNKASQEYLCSVYFGATSRKVLAFLKKHHENKKQRCATGGTMTEENEFISLKGLISYINEDSECVICSKGSDIMTLNHLCREFDGKSVRITIEEEREDE